MKSWIFLQTYDTDRGGLSTNICVYDKENFLAAIRSGYRNANRFAEVNTTVNSAKHFYYITLDEFNEIFGNDNLTEEEITRIAGTKSEVSKKIGVDRHYVNLEPIPMKELEPGCVYENSDHQLFVFGGRIAKGKYDQGYTRPNWGDDLKGKYFLKQLWHDKQKKYTKLLDLLTGDGFDFKGNDICGTKKLVKKTNMVFEIPDKIDLSYQRYANSSKETLYIEFKK